MPIATSSIAGVVGFAAQSPYIPWHRLPRTIRSFLSVLWPLPGAGFPLARAWQVTKAACQVFEYGETSPTLVVPMIWHGVPILIGAPLAVIFCVQQMGQRGAPS